MADDGRYSRENQLLALLYRIEELIMELRVCGKDSQDYKDLLRIISNLEKYKKNDN